MTARHGLAWRLCAMGVALDVMATVSMCPGTVTGAAPCIGIEDCVSVVSSAVRMLAELLTPPLTPARAAERPGAANQGEAEQDAAGHLTGVGGAGQRRAGAVVLAEGPRHDGPVGASRCDKSRRARAESEGELAAGLRLCDLAAVAGKELWCRACEHVVHSLRGSRGSGWWGGAGQGGASAIVLAEGPRHGGACVGRNRMVGA